MSGSYEEPTNEYFQSNSGDRQLNPWLAIWTRPRATIRQIVNTDPKQHVLLLASLTGINRALDRAVSKNAGDVLSLEAILGVALIGGPIGGILTIYLLAWLTKVTGRWLGGNATSEEVRAAMAWGAVPAVAASVWWLPNIAFFGRELFMSDSPRLASSISLSMMLLTTTFVAVVAGVWSAVLTFKAIGEVHHFSAWRAFGSATLAFSLLILVALVLAIPVVMIALLSGTGAH